MVRTAPKIIECLVILAVFAVILTVGFPRRAKPSHGSTPPGARVATL
ncbi:MAG: hypothetical protein ACO1SV_24500 [Fimbriimonas sp.]